MSQLVYCGIDFHKNKSYLYATDSDRNVVMDVEIRSAQIVKYLSNRSNLRIAIEATGGSNHLATELANVGHTVILVETNQFDPANKKRSKKTDREDAISLCKYLRMDELPEVHLKSESSRALKTFLVQRELIVNQRRNLTNHIRGVLREWGFVMPTGTEAFWKNAGRLVEAINHPTIKELLKFSMQIASELVAKEQEVNKQIESMAHASEDASRLMGIPGVGPLTALLMVAIVDRIDRFEDARSFAAYLGLTPREFSSGDKRRLGAITRSGPEMLRRYLIHGARAVLLRAGERTAQDPNRQWAMRVKERSSTNKSVVALAHRTARICFGLMKNQSYYDPHHARKSEAA
jgi:transposase